ncbi:hypothetical protein QYZ87_07830 [Porphyromonadaceae bacterium W3.11]|nr:hypothetical protein [Porphyromonadaceae bacterium W3.11]
MQQISLVTARVVRENEQYAYKLVGKGEKYLVRHEDGDNAGESIREALNVMDDFHVLADVAVTSIAITNISGVL